MDQFRPDQHLLRPPDQMWRARFHCSGKHVNLGRFATAREAAFAHDRAAYFIHGEAAQTNFGQDAARKWNEREAPTSSWLVMLTLEALAKQVGMQRDDIAGGGRGGWW